MGYSNIKNMKNILENLKNIEMNRHNTLVFKLSAITLNHISYVKYTIITHIQIFFYYWDFILQKIDQDVRKEVTESEKLAIADTGPPLEDMYDHIYVQPEADFKVRTCDPVTMVASR